MQRRFRLVLWLMLGSALAAAIGGADAANRASADLPDIVGIYLTTQYPALTVRTGETTTIDLALHNFRQPPQMMNLSVPEVAPGWKATILGGGQPIGSTIVPPDSEANLQLRLEPPAKETPGDYRFVVEAQGGSNELKLPITLTVGRELPAKLKLTTSFPALRGTAATSFKFTVTVANDSGRNATINLSATTPKGFQTTFTEAYGSQQITSIPIEAGKSKDVDMSVTLPHETPAGDYKLLLHARSEAAAAELPLGIAIVGQPRLAVSGEGGRLSGNAYAGQASQLAVIVSNNGSEAARDVQLTASAPEGWKTSFEPKQIVEIAPGKSQSVQATLTPSARAIAGDYQMTVSADSAGGQTDSASFRITVLTSTLWGAVGVAVIAVALLVVVFAIARFGRR